jgi:lipoprotein Spr
MNLPLDKRHICGWALLFLLITGCHTVRDVSQHSTQSIAEKNKSADLRQKYGNILGIEPDRINNIKLYSFIDEWTGTPYRYGGKNQQGIDCSGFTEILYHTVFARDIIGSSKDLFLQCKPIPKDHLKEGDLVFFKIESEHISHVGIYLANNKFVHATVKRGVMISDLGEAYYLKYYCEGGRLKEK